MKIKRNKDEVILKEKDLNLLGETMVTMGADLFQTLYDMSDDMDYTMTACLIRDAAMEFEQKKLEQWREIYT